MFKRVAFEHEKEFRLFHWDHASISNKTKSPDGISVTVLIERLIEKIVISPHAPAWFVEVVTSLTKDYGFNIPINKSNLLEPLIH